LKIIAALEEYDALTADQKGWRRWIEAELAKLRSVQFR